MSHAGWGDIWNLVFAIARAQPAPIQILMGLGAAFAVVMFLEGLRASFLPGYRALPHLPYIRTKPASAKLAPKAGSRDADTSKTSSIAVSGLAPFRPRELSRPRYNQKKPKPNTNRQRAQRPTVKRDSLGDFAAFYAAPEQRDYAVSPMFTDEAAPYSPLPPIMEMDGV